MILRAADLRARQRFRTVSGRLGVVLRRRTNRVEVALSSPAQIRSLHPRVVVVVEGRRAVP